MTRLMALAIGAVLVLAASAGTAAAHELAPDELADVGFQQHLGASVPLDLAFRDEDGNPVTLGTYFQAARPVMLSLNYFHCQFVCPLEEDGLINGLNGVKLTLGQDFTLLTVSIDPRDTPLDATSVKARLLRGYDRPQGADGWHLLTGDELSIARLTQSVGFEYVADPQQGDFAHPIGIVLLTPDGRISRYVSGLDFAAGDLEAGLGQASGNGIANMLDRVAMVCYQYDPLSGRYTPLALSVVRIGGGMGLVLVVVWLGWLWLADVRRQHV